MKIRDYQRDSIRKLFEARSFNPLYVLPTGGGKTFVMTRYCRMMRSHNGDRILWMVHRKELVLQAKETLIRNGLDPAVIMSGYEPEYDKPVQVASVDTLVNRLDKVQAPNIIVIDEAHHAIASTYKKIFKHFPRAKRIGCTATPYRLDGSGLGEIFGIGIQGASVFDLVEQGFLIHPRTFRWDIPEGLKNVSMKRGDFDAVMVAKVMSERKILGDIVNHWIDKAYMQRTICFAATVEQSKSIVETFQKLKIPAEHLDGTTPKDQREAILSRLSTGETKIVSNVGILTEGFDCPACSAIILAMMTKSHAKWRQCIGRCMRPDESNRAVILDHCGNSFLHGDVMEEPDWTLEGISKSPTQGTGLKTCPFCFCCSRNYAKFCIDCGKPFTIDGKKDREYKLVRGKLVESDTPISYQQKCFWNDHLKKNTPVPELIKLYIKEFNEQPIIINSDQLILPNLATMEEKKNVWMIQMRFTGSVLIADRRYRDIFDVWPRGKNKWYKEYLKELDDKFMVK